MKNARKNSRARGATFIAWIGILAAGGFAVIASLLSAQTTHYAMAVEEARQREALYAAEAGLARAAAALRRGEAIPAEGMGFDCGRALVIVSATPGGEPGRTALVSVASIRIGERAHTQSVRAAAIERDGGAELSDFEWEQHHE